MPGFKGNNGKARNVSSRQRRARPHLSFSPEVSDEETGSLESYSYTYDTDSLEEGEPGDTTPKESRKTISSSVRRRRLVGVVAIILACAGIGLNLWGYTALRAQEHSGWRGQLEVEADLFTFALTRDIEFIHFGIDLSVIEVVQGLRSDSLSLLNFVAQTQPFVDQLGQGLTAISYLTRVTGTENALEFERKLQQEWVAFGVRQPIKLTNFTDICPTCPIVPGRNDIMFPVTYINPPSGNINVIGFDLQSHPERVEFVRKALRADTEYTTTAPITLVQSTKTEKGKAFLVMKSVTLDSEIKGLVAGVFRVADVVKRVHAATESVFAVQVYDITDLTDVEMNDPDEAYGEVMFDEMAIAYQPPVEVPVYRVLDVNNRKWRIALYPYRRGLNKFLSATPGVVLGSSIAFIALVGCLIALTIYYMTKLEQLSKQLEVQFKRAEQSRDEANEGARWNDWFLAHMSHEIRSPLNGIIGLLSILPNQDDPTSKRENLMGREELMSYIAVLQRSTKGLKVVLDDILTVCKGKAGIDILESSYNVRDLVAGVNQMSASSVRGKLDVLMFVSREVPEMVLGDEARLRQVLLNLVSNAINFTQEGEICVLVEVVDSLEVTKAVSLSSDTIFTRLHLLPGSHSNADTSTRPVGIRFSVVDSGCGIPSEQVKRIFEAFVQGSPSTSRRHVGTGLGLTIANHLITYMGGTITCHSVVGVGTEFSFVLPFKLPPTSPSAASKGSLNDGPAGTDAGEMGAIGGGGGGNKVGGNAASASSATTVTTITTTADHVSSRRSPQLRARSDRSDASLSTELSLSQALLQAKATKDLHSLGHDKMEPTVWAIDPQETSRLFIKHLLPKGTCQSFPPKAALSKLKDSNGLSCPNAFLVTALNWDRDVDIRLDAYLVDLVRSTRGQAGGVLICIPFREIVAPALIHELQEIHPLLPIKFLPWPLWHRDLITALADFSRVQLQLSEPLSRGSTSTLWSTTVPKINTEAVQNMVRDVVAGSHKPAAGVAGSPSGWADGFRPRDNDNDNDNDNDEHRSPHHGSSSTMHSAPLRLRGLPPRPTPQSPSGSMRGASQTMSHLGPRLHQLHGEGSISAKSGRSGHSGGKWPLGHLSGKGSPRKRLLNMRTLPVSFPDPAGRGSTGGSPSSQNTGDKDENGFEGLTVLVIEDQTVNQLVLCMHLRAAGHRCLVANDGDVGARTYFENHKAVDVCLIDYHMPVVDGLGCARRIRDYEQRQGWPPTLLYSLTADTRPQTAELIKEAGYSHMMLKPLDFQQLIKELRELKEAKRLRYGT